MEIDHHRTALLSKVTRWNMKLHNHLQKVKEQQSHSFCYSPSPIRLSSSTYTVRWSLWHSESISRSNSRNSRRIYSPAATRMDHKHILHQKIKHKLLWKFKVLLLVANICNRSKTICCRMGVRIRGPCNGGQLERAVQVNLTPLILRSALATDTRDCGL